MSRVTLRVFVLSSTSLAFFAAPSPTCVPRCHLKRLDTSKDTAFPNFIALRDQTDQSTPKYGISSFSTNKAAHGLRIEFRPTRNDLNPCAPRNMSTQSRCSQLPGPRYEARCIYTHSKTLPGADACSTKLSIQNSALAGRLRSDKPTRISSSTKNRHDSSFSPRSSRQTSLHARELSGGTLPLSSWTVVISCLLLSVEVDYVCALSSLTKVFERNVPISFSSLVHSKRIQNPTCKIGAFQVNCVAMMNSWISQHPSILWPNEKPAPLPPSRELFIIIVLRDADLGSRLGEWSICGTIAPLGLIAAIASRARVAIAMSCEGSLKIAWQGVDLGTCDGRCGGLLVAVGNCII
ncbi:hypothetical protein B0H13DRAFT_2268244 [Mycena leptocephala]|nr:hypothetical protein B0H13DRAFT_2268244 [Mycena leptocephala]